MKWKMIDYGKQQCLLKKKQRLCKENGNACNVTQKGKKRQSVIMTSLCTKYGRRLSNGIQQSGKL